ncbi:hypothetical protein BC830DRAFT_1131136 [Chytriomyces sp. MP71]|nr:hypothetical protein BC830DRAFT_1131136 [Chytriomyces sp. MP71]
MDATTTSPAEAVGKLLSILGSTIASSDGVKPSDLVTSSEILAIELAVKTPCSSSHWPPYVSHALDGFIASPTINEAHLLDFTPPEATEVAMSVEGLLVPTDELASLLASPKQGYDVAVASIRYWAAYDAAFQTLLTLALHNHHLSKIFFDPKASPLSVSVREDAIAAYHLGNYLKKLGCMNIAAQWFQVSSEAEYPLGMVEYAKILCSPGWAYHLSTLSNPTTTSRVTFADARVPGLRIKTSKSLPNHIHKQDLLENSIDASRAISLLHTSHNLEPISESAYLIGMLYLTAPTKSAYQEVLGSSRVGSSTSSPNSSGSPSRSEFAAPESPSRQKWPELFNPKSPKIHILNLHRDFSQAAQYLALAVSISNKNAENDVATSKDMVIATAAAFELAKLNLKLGKEDALERASVLLQGIAALEPSKEIETVIFLASHLLGHCLKQGFGEKGGISKEEEGNAWLKISAVQTNVAVLVGDRGRPNSRIMQIILGSNASRRVLRMAVMCLKRQVESNFDWTFGMFLLGICLKLGVGGVVDVCKGEYWMRRAADTRTWDIKDCDTFVQVCSDLGLMTSIIEIFGASLSDENRTVKVSPSIPNETDDLSPLSAASIDSIASLPPLPKYVLRIII